MKTINRIAYSNDKRNRTRSILIMMAICLTTMLLVIISTVGNGVIHLQKSQAASSYGSNYGLFIAADGTQLKEVERRAEISDIAPCVRDLYCLVNVLLYGHLVVSVIIHCDFHVGVFRFFCVVCGIVAVYIMY